MGCWNFRVIFLKWSVIAGEFFCPAEPKGRWWRRRVACTQRLSPALGYHGFPHHLWWPKTSSTLQGKWWQVGHLCMEAELCPRVTWFPPSPVAARGLFHSAAPRQDDGSEGISCSETELCPRGPLPLCVAQLIVTIYKVIGSWVLVCVCYFVCYCFKAKPEMLKTYSWLCS